jgi:hypothetical protein
MEQSKEACISLNIFDRSLALAKIKRLLGSPVLDSYPLRCRKLDPDGRIESAGPIPLSARSLVISDR